MGGVLVTPEQLAVHSVRINVRAVRRTTRRLMGHLGAIMGARGTRVVRKPEQRLKYLCNAP
jgi:hypothetical protein